MSAASIYRMPSESPKQVPYGYCQCGCGEKTTIAKRTFGKEGIRKGESRRYIKTHGHREAIYERFWQYVDKNGPVVRAELGPCWIWTGKKNDHNYGLLSDSRVKTGKFIRAHRLSYELHLGEIPPGLLVLHQCDNRLCCNPSHLRLGTHKDNGREASERGRLPVGSSSVSSKLTDVQVKDIRAKYKYREVIIQRITDESGCIVTLQQLADKYKVNGTTIFQILNGRSWKHLPIN